MQLPEFIKRDWGRKLVAVFMAGIIWVTVHQQLQVNSTLRDVNVNVHVTTSPDLIMLDQKPPRVRVTVRGSRRRVPNVSTAEIHVKAHVVEISDRRHNIELRSPNVVLPAGISLVEIEPSTIDVMIDHLEDAERPIAVKFEGELARQFARNVRILPVTANISGPKHLLKQITEIETEPIQLSPEITRDFEDEVALVPPPQITVNPAKVTVEVSLYRRLETKEFDKLKVHILHAIDSPFEVTALDPPDAKIKVLIEGPTSTLDVLLRASVQPYIDLSDVRSADQVPMHIKVEFSNAKDCRVLKVTPPFIKANVRMKEKTP
jgi:YbbR domain-containing protein